MISYFMEDPRGALMYLLLMLPGCIMALSVHEFAHAWMANRCGDPTARYLGRMTVNPAKHLDPMGSLLMLVLGVGWAKPVPVNPRNFRNYRRDDLKVSIAGISMNLLMFLASFLVMCIVLMATLASMPRYSSFLLANEDMFVTRYLGQTVVMTEEYYFPVKELLINAPYAAEFLIEPVMGRLAGYVYQMLGYFCLVNISLAIFNLLPIPPLDGYHVLNDLVLKKSLFVSRKVGQIASIVLFVLVLRTDVISNLIGAVQTTVMGWVGSGMYALFQLLGF